LKILLTGPDGQVGAELAVTLRDLGEVVALDRGALDLSQPHQVAPALDRIRPDIIVNAAAYTAVDQAERDEQTAFAVNARSVSEMARVAADLDALLLHFSTDYVFDGSKSAPYVETDRPCPINAYGRSKLAGEQAIFASGCRHLILRTSWVYAARGNNFMLTMLRLARERPELRIVFDQLGAPTWAHDLALAARSALRHPAPPQGLFHVTSSGTTNWFEFARRILQIAGLTTPVVPILTAEYPTPAARPCYSVLNSDRFAQATGFRIGPWEQRLEQCMSGMRQARARD
jgi:dTDP-4-dehydrorhamnose reductase